MLRENITMHNTYTIYKEIEGVVTKEAEFNNIVVKKGKELFAKGNYIYALAAGSGSTVPSESDTALSKYLWSTTTIENIQLPEIVENMWELKFRFKFPATTSYVGTITELALYSSSINSNYIMTRALIKDTEGNPISITKTDIEVLYVDIHMQMRLSSNSHLVWIPHYFRYKNDHSLIAAFPNFSNMFMYACGAYPDEFTDGRRLGSKVTPTMTYSTSTDTMQASKGRFTTDNMPNQTYINAIILIPDGGTYSANNPMACWKFPDSDVFPPVTLANMRVGTGDGETTEFVPPLNFWMKDTEKIYVDNVLQIRGVDYTCDHINNLSGQYALMPSNFCKIKNKIKRESSATNVSHYGYHPLKGGYIQNYSGWSEGTSYTYYSLEWDNEHPLEWELIEDPQIPIDADTFVMQGITARHGTFSSYNMQGVKFTLSYSVDGQSWNEIETYTQTTPESVASYTFRFETVRAKYWKLSVDMSEAKFTTIRNYSVCCNDNNKLSYLRKQGKPIVFAKPPENGAIITMEADIDRPMKNENFVIDVNPTFSF